MCRQNSFNPNTFEEVKRVGVQYQTAKNYSGTMDPLLIEERQKRDGRNYAINEFHPCMRPKGVHN